MISKLTVMEYYQKLPVIFLNATEKQEILKAIGTPKKSSVYFKSIFSDKISEQEWSTSKE